MAPPQVRFETIQLRRTIAKFLFLISVLGGIVLLLDVGGKLGDMAVNTFFTFVPVVFACAVAVRVFSMETQKVFWTRVFASALCAKLATFLFLAYYSSWCCVSEAKLGETCELYVDVHAALEEAGIDHWVCYGSLIGPLRDSSRPFQTLPWEHDQDICVNISDVKRIKEALTTQQWKGRTAFVLTEEEPNPSTLTTAARMYYADYKTSFHRIMARSYIDFYAFEFQDGGNKVVQVGDSSVNFDREIVFPTAIVPSLRLCNSAKLRYPKDPMGMARKMFGRRFMEGAKVPGNLHGLRCKVHMDGCSDWIPSYASNK